MLSCASFDLPHYLILMSAYLLLCIGTNPSTSHAKKPSVQQSQAANTNQVKTPPIKRLDQDRALVGDVLVNRRTKRIARRNG